MDGVLVEGVVEVALGVAAETLMGGALLLVWAELLSLTEADATQLVAGVVAVDAVEKAAIESVEAALDVSEAVAAEEASCGDGIKDEAGDGVREDEGVSW